MSQPVDPKDRTLMAAPKQRSQFGVKAAVPVERVSGPRPPVAAGGSVGSTRAWKPFRWGNLEKVTRLQGQLVRRLEWMLPSVSSSGDVSAEVGERLHQLLEEQVQLTGDYVHVVPTRNLRRYIGDPTFLAVLAPQPNKTRGFLEIELSLAHAAIDMLLGGAGEAISPRPLTDIEEGVMTYVILETLKALAPSIDPALPKLRYEGVCRNFEEAVQLMGDEQYVAVVQLKANFGSHSGYLRLFVPQAVLSLANPPGDAAVRRARRAADAKAHITRLSAVKTWLRAEIGTVQISAEELQQIRERDVVLVDNLTAQPHKGEGGTARLKVGAGLHGWLEAEVVVQNDQYQAKITALTTGEGEGPVEALEELQDDDKSVAGADESTNPGTDPRGREAKVDETLKGSEGAELLNDIPLQVAVELARVPISAEEVVALKVGQVIDLNRVAGEPIDLSVNGKIVARGELVEVDGNLGVRVLSLAG
ncbi:MAG: type III secretion system cytoplasmic ring protein SctQ [Archangiaceae bacterium]|nr:type III secretion system cytoplasmic ring protein SctQ [Archangiaceae bacterium]